MNIEFYSDELPGFLKEFCEVSSLQRLKKVGMHCGCEYTNFERKALVKHNFVNLFL